MTTVAGADGSVRSTESVAARVVGLTKVYGSGNAEVRALDGVTLDIIEGEFTAVMGPSGSGKSTLMHCCAALDAPTAGEVYVGDTEIGSLSDKNLTLLRRDRIGFVFQSFNLIPTLTAEENILLPLSIAHRKPDPEWYDAVIDSMRLRDRLDHRPNQLSGGQQQRVAMARALASRPSIVFADEPTGNLDSRSGAEVLSLLRASVDDHHQTIVMVTHDPVAAAYTDRVVFLADGKIVDELRNPDREQVLHKMQDLAEASTRRRRRGPEVRLVTWRNLIARKVRLLLSGFAIVLGVAFVAGSMIFTDAMGGAFDDIIEGGAADVEVAFEGAGDFDSGEDNRTFPASVVADLERVPEVGSAHPQNTLQTVFVIGKNGKVVGGNGPPGLANNPTGADSLTGKPVLRVVEGAYPDGPNEIALDVDTAEKGGFAVGDPVQLATPGDPPVIDTRLTGIVEFGSGGLNGATLTIFDTGFMQQQFFDGKDVFSTVSLNAAPGVSQRELAEAAQKVLPEGLVARTGDDYVETNKASLDEILGFLQTFLLVFAGVALVVGIFLIINTFSILVAQRSREFALLRALGASRGQVNRSVLFESLAVGMVGSSVGLGVGYLLALGLRAIFGLIGLDLSRAEFPVTWQTVAWAYGVGIVVTAIASILPALRAARIPPMAALRDDVALPESTLRRRVFLGTAMVLLGAGTMALGLAGSGTRALAGLGGGILLVLVGVSLMSAFLGAPVLRLFDVVYRRLFGAVGRLAAQNALRNPRRTGATASALMIGLALMTMMSIFGTSASASTDAAIGKTLTSQFVISNVVGQPFSPAVATQVAELDGVADVTEIRSAYPDLKGGGSAWTIGVDPAALGAAIALPMSAGSLADLRPGRVAIAENEAERRGFAVGDEITMEFQARDIALEVVALFPRSPVLPGEYVVTPDTLDRGGLKPLDALVFVTKDPDASTDAVRTEIESVISGLPTVTVKDPEGFAAEQKEQVNQFLYLIYGLLGLSVIIAILGVINTLSLSVIERTREIGLLRAVGVSRRQLRTMIRLESVVVAVLGAVLGLVMGVVFGSSMVTALRDQGLTDLAVPWLWLVGFLLLGTLAGVIAAVLPARRAARLDVLKAIATE